MPIWLNITLQIILWFGIIFLAYVEIGYPLLLWLISKYHKVEFPTKTVFQPSVTVLIAAYNEEGIIGARLNNIMEQEYPHELMQIIVASDRSTDNTDDIVRSYADWGVILCRSEEHYGKIAALRKAEPLITSDLVIFTDADSYFEAGTIQKLIKHFSDPKVGAVSGREIRPSTQSSSKGEGLFNRIETQVKTLESKIGDQVLLHGGIFAIRRELLPFVPDHLTHDAIIPLKLTLAGYRTEYDPDAISVEGYNLDSRQDFQRRVRTVLQAYQSYLYVKTALNPMKTGFYAIQILSHRFMRWFVFPVLMIVLLSSLLLSGTSDLYLGFVIIQITCYVLAALGFIFDRRDFQPALFYFPFYFLYVHLAAMIAVIFTWGGKTISTWKVGSR